MKLNIPTKLSDITLSQFMQYRAYINSNPNITKRQLNNKSISIFCNIKMSDVDQIPVKDYKDIVTLINGALNEDAKPIILHYKELSFIPNLDNITAGEYADLEVFYKEDDSELDKVMNVLYRPRTTKILDHYSIQSYDSDDPIHPLVSSMPMNVVRGAIGFFLTLRDELLACTLKYSKQENNQMQPT